MCFLIKIYCFEAKMSQKGIINNPGGDKLEWTNCLNELDLVTMSTLGKQWFSLHLRKFIPTKLPQTSFELGSLGLLARLLPINQPLLVKKYIKKHILNVVHGVCLLKYTTKTGVNVCGGGGCKSDSRNS